MTTSVATKPVTSIFSNAETGLFTTYSVQLVFRDKLLGGIPKQANIIESWLRTNTGLTDNPTELRRMLVKTLEELGLDVEEGMTFEELQEASKKLAGSSHTNGFKLDANGLYIEDRQVKAMIKEAVNILFAGQRWGVTKKGPRGFTSERVFVSPSHISLGRSEPDGTEMMIVHASTPQGPRTSLAYHEYVEGATIDFNVMVANDDVDEAHWPLIWTLAQENALGACRSQSYGRFDVTRWDKIDG